MEVFEAVRTLLAVREFQDKPVPPDAARLIVEAARLTGSSANRIVNEVPAVNRVVYDITSKPPGTIEWE